MKPIQKAIKYGIVCCLLLFLSNTVKAQQTKTQPQDTLAIDIKQALDIALSENPTIKIANMEITRIDYLKKESWGGMLPTISATGQYNNNVLAQTMFMGQIPMHMPIGQGPNGEVIYADGYMGGGPLKMGAKHNPSLGASATLPLFAMGLYRNIQLSSIEMQGALETIRSSKINLTSEVRNAYFSVLLAQKAHGVLLESYNNALETFNNVKNMYEQGIVSEYDKIRTDVRVRNVLPNVAEAQQMADLAMLRLKVLLSLPISTNLKLETYFTEFEQEIEQFEPQSSYSLKNNTNLKQLDIQISKMEKQRQLVNTSMIPTLAAFGNWGLQTQADRFSDLFDAPYYNSFIVGLSLNIPIFKGGTNIMKAKQLQIATNQMHLQRDYTEDNLNMALQNQINNMLKAKIQLESNREAIKEAEKGYNIATIRYNTGQGTILDLNDSEIALTQASLNYYQAIYNYLVAITELQKLQGNEY